MSTVESHPTGNTGELKHGPNADPRDTLRTILHLSDGGTAHYLYPLSRVETAIFDARTDAPQEKVVQTAVDIILRPVPTEAIARKAEDVVSMLSLPDGSAPHTQTGIATFERHFITIRQEAVYRALTYLFDADLLSDNQARDILLHRVLADFTDTQTTEGRYGRPIILERFPEMDRVFLHPAATRIMRKRFADHLIQPGGSDDPKAVAIALSRMLLPYDWTGELLDIPHERMYGTILTALTSGNYNESFDAALPDLIRRFENFRYTYYEYDESKIVGDLLTFLIARTDTDPSQTGRYRRTILTSLANTRDWPELQYTPAGATLIDLILTDFRADVPQEFSLAVAKTFF